MSNFTRVYFPGLGIDFDLPSVAFSIGNYDIHFYGIIIAFGFMLAVLYGGRMAYKWRMSLDGMTDVLIWGTIFGIICARAYYVIFEWSYYSAHPAEIVQIWNGGLAIYGGVIGAMVGMAVYARIKKVRLAAGMDITMLGFLIGQFIGRWGNFVNREAFGAATDSFFRMGLFNTQTGAWEYYHPTFLYESLWNFCGFFLLHYLSKKRRYDGQIALDYAAWYGLGRYMIEGLRMDSLWWGPVRVSQVLAGVTCLAASLLLIWLSFRPHDPAKLWVNQVAARKASAQTEEPKEPNE